MNIFDTILLRTVAIIVLLLMLAAAGCPVGQSRTFYLSIDGIPHTFVLGAK